MQGKRMQGESAKQVAIDALRAAGEPLHTKEVAKRVLDSGRCSRLQGKTPEATVAALLAVGSKPGGPFKRVAKGTYTLSDPIPTDEGKQRAQPRLRRQERRLNGGLRLRHEKQHRVHSAEHDVAAVPRGDHEQVGREFRLEQQQHRLRPRPASLHALDQNRGHRQNGHRAPAGEKRPHAHAQGH